jgi:uncharacterized protein
MDRRSFLKSTGAAAGLGLLAPEFWRDAFVSAATPGRGPYGPLGEVDANGLRLPAGFTSRIVAVTGRQVGTTGYTWHPLPDGGQCFPHPDGGWIYVSNSEVGHQQGGCSAIRFRSNGSIHSAYSILSGTSRNCSGGITPWRTYLSCEETSVPPGQVYECDPYKPGVGVLRAAMGAFNHEAAVIDPATGHAYLTEDEPDGRLYRFVPTLRGDLSRGALFAASLDGTTVSWIPTSSSGPDRQPSTTAFNGGEGMYVGDGAVYFTTKGDKRVWELTPRTNQLVVLHDASGNAPDNLNAVDAVVVHHRSGDLFVAEDGGNMEVGVIGLANGEREVASFLRIEGHRGSEVTGLAFSPDGRRLYLSSQRGSDGATGVTWEVIGPFRTAPARRLIDRDSYVRGGVDSARNYGLVPELQVCNNSSDRYTKIAYLSVDTEAYEPAVSSALLRLSARMSKGGPSTLRVHALTSSFAERSITWEDRPALGPVIARFTVTGTDELTYDVDISDHVIAERAAGRSRIDLALVQQTPGEVALVRSRQALRARPLVVLSPVLFPRLQAVVLPVARDAHVRGGVSELTNYGTAPLLEIRNSTDIAQTRWAYLAIDTRNFVRDISSARLRVHARSTGAVPQVIDVFATSTSWTSSNLTWADRPAAGDHLGSFSVSSTDLTPSSIDIGTHVSAARARGETTIAVLLRAAQPGPLVEVASTELRSNVPRLVVL